MSAGETEAQSGFRPLKQPDNLTATLAARLRDEITSGRLIAGERLPTEQSMMATFGISRTVIREAVSALKAEGLVITRQGSGAFVAPVTARRPFHLDPAQLKSIRDVMQLMELRAGVEAEAAGLAADRRDNTDLDAIAVTLDRMDAAIDAGEIAISADADFHRAIAKATQNAYHLKFLEFLGNFTIPRQRIHLDVQTPAEQSTYLRGVQVEHRKIYAAIKAQDPVAAREAARYHCMNSRARYQEIAETAERQGDNPETTND